MNQEDGLTPLMPYAIPNSKSESGSMRCVKKRVRWLLNKAEIKMLGCVLIVLVMSACTKTITVKPVCNVPQLQPLPVIMSDDMECIGDEVYWALMDRERLLTDWALEMQATLQVVCD